VKKTHGDLDHCRHELHLRSLENYISRLRSPVDFKIYDWLRTLRTSQLKCIEVDAKTCTGGDADFTMYTTMLNDLGAIALMAYSAENYLKEDTDCDADLLHDLLIGLAVAARIEQLKRNGWVTVTSRISIVLRDPRPYRVTQRGLERGAWSEDPMTLWILGNNLLLH
jgi:hypothetical protein